MYQFNHESFDGEAISNIFTYKSLPNTTSDVHTLLLHRVYTPITAVIRWERSRYGVPADEGTTHSRDEMDERDYNVND